MATIRVSSVDGNDADNGSTWALAKATLAGALSAASAGDTIYIDNAHAETQASAMTLTSPGTAALPVRILCVDRSTGDAPTARATTATVSTTGANNMTFAGFASVYGVTFTAGNSTASADMTFGSAAASGWMLDTCGLTLGGSGTGSDIFIGANADVSQGVTLINTTVTMGNAANRFAIRVVSQSE